jgi:hypothetical protein
MVVPLPAMMPVVGTAAAAAAPSFVDHKRKRNSLPPPGASSEEGARIAYTHSGHAMVVQPVHSVSPRESQLGLEEYDERDVDMSSAGSTSSFSHPSSGINSDASSSSSTPGSEGRSYAVVPSAGMDSPLGRIYKRVCMSTPMMLAQSLKERMSTNVYPTSLATFGSTPLYDGTPPQLGSQHDLLESHPVRVHDLDALSSRQRSQSSGKQGDLNMDAHNHNRTFVKAKRAGQHMQHCPPASESFASSPSVAPSAHMLMSPAVGYLSAFPSVAHTASNFQDTTAASSTPHGHVSLSNSPASSVGSAQRSPQGLFFPDAFFAASRPNPSSSIHVPSHPSNARSNSGQAHRRPVAIVSPAERQKERQGDMVDAVETTPLSSAPSSTSSSLKHTKRPIINGTPQGLEPRSVGFRENQSNKHKRMKEEGSGGGEYVHQAHLPEYDPLLQSGPSASSSHFPSSSPAAPEGEMKRWTSEPNAGVGEKPTYARVPSNTPQVSHRTESKTHGWNRALDHLSRSMDAVQLVDRRQREEGEEMQSRLDPRTHDDITLLELERPRSPLPPRSSSALSHHADSRNGSRLAHRRLLAAALSSPAQQWKQSPDSTVAQMGSPDGFSTLSPQQQDRRFSHNEAEEAVDLVNRKRRDPNAMSVQRISSTGTELEGNISSSESNSDSEDEHEPRSVMAHQVQLSPAMLVAISAPLLPPSPITSPLHGELPSTGAFAGALKFAQQKALLTPVDSSPSQDSVQQQEQKQEESQGRQHVPTWPASSRTQ